MRKWTIDTLKMMYKNGKLTPLVLIENIIRQAEQEKESNIWIVPPALSHIKPYLDNLEHKNPDEYPLWGIPFAIKDNIDLAEVTTTAACPAYAYLPEKSAEIVSRLVEAGAIPIGKTNLDQFATGLVGTRSPFGETHNSLKPELISGGSSSGSAVAVARGQAVFSLGTDTAGSGRIPAALNDLVGYKSAIGDWPTRGVVPACATLDCVTVFANTLEDAYLIDAVARGKRKSGVGTDIYETIASMKPQKILLPKEQLYFYGDYKDSYRMAWEGTVRRLELCGIPIEYVDSSIFNKTSSLLYDGPWVAERWSDLGEFVESHPGEIFPVTEQILRSSLVKGYNAASVFKALHELREYKEQASSLLKDAVLVMPTCGGTWTREQVAASPVSTNSDMGYYTNHCNLLDLCAVALPSDYAEEQLPFGITMFSMRGQESILNGASAEFLKTESIELAVCGLHMRGFPLEKQLLNCGASFVRSDWTAPCYRLIRLNSIPAKPGLIRSEQGGSIAVEVWRIPVVRLGEFIRLVPAPLGIGKIKLEGGSEITGFICEPYAEQNGEDITSYGGWAAAETDRLRNDTSAIG
ncbi:allophanate hydrolase [Paenibacillus polymyxa]|uniref:allophanate hydrolase n=1 Tax=Paenibacillus polymyxa TaxID=1406 RepID=UPI0003D395BC|nr:allophanate hydrolase [Paenibacillus polymyxa]AIW40974.1 allophanate hydrolase [Paenibacillus polymyxa CR1]